MVCLKHILIFQSGMQVLVEPLKTYFFSWSVTVC